MGYYLGTGPLSETVIMVTQLKERFFIDRYS